MILVTAANGNQGKLLIPKLLAMKLPVRACVLTQASAQAMRAAGVNDVVVGDITDPALLAKAIKGVEKVYHVGPTMNPKEREMGIALVDAASANGIKHFVFSSVLHAITSDIVQHEVKQDVEEHQLSSGLQYTSWSPQADTTRIRLAKSSRALSGARSGLRKSMPTPILRRGWEMPTQVNFRIRSACCVPLPDATAITASWGTPTCLPGC